VEEVLCIKPSTWLTRENNLIGLNKHRKGTGYRGGVVPVGEIRLKKRKKTICRWEGYFFFFVSKLRPPTTDI